MSTRHLYLSIAVAGFLLPMSQVVPWVVEHGLSPVAMGAELFSTRIGAFFGLDVLVSAVAVVAMVAREGREMAARERWLSIAATCAIGVSCGLPLFLYLRARGADERRPPRVVV